MHPTTETEQATRPTRTADPAREVVLSVAVLVATTATYAALMSLVLAPDRIPASDAVFWLAPTVWAVTLALAVALRARDARRRLLALATMALVLCLALVHPLLLAPGYDIDRARELRWLLDITSHGAGLLALAAWGIARRHGRWWWLGLVPALGLDLVEPSLYLAVFDAVPRAWWGTVAVSVGMLVPAAGGLICWIVDVLTTRPTCSEPRGRLGA